MVGVVATGEYAALAPRRTRDSPAILVTKDSKPMSDQNDHHDRKPILRAVSGVMITLASAFSPSAFDDEPARELVPQLLPPPTVAVSSAPTVRGSSIAYRT